MKKKDTNHSNGKNKASVGKVFTGLVVGSVVGATVGLLLAPASGEETISRIKTQAKGIQKKARNAVGNIEDKARGLGDKAHNLAREVSTDVSEVKEDVSERVGEYFTTSNASNASNSRRKNSSS